MSKKYMLSMLPLVEATYLWTNGRSVPLFHDEWKMILYRKKVISYKFTAISYNNIFFPFLVSVECSIFVVSKPDLYRQNE